MKFYFRVVLAFSFCLFFLSCRSGEDQNVVSEISQSDVPSEYVKSEGIKDGSLNEFDRKSSLDKLTKKVSQGIPLVVHVRIPLCDNDNQGIVPVGRLIGNGLDLGNNLYWGAKYGLKNHFRKHTNWKMLASMKDVNNVILERVIFYKEFDNNAKVFLVADAYRGDKMNECLIEYINSLAGNRAEIINVNDIDIALGSGADLIVFNGHNGLMDYNMDVVNSIDDVSREASVIGCISHEYFKDHLRSSKAYPVLMTTNLMAPEAYVLEAVVDSWARLRIGSDIRLEAGKAYNKYQKCGIKGATKLFKTGW